MTKESWTYNASETGVLSVSMSDALAAPAKHIVFQSLRDVSRTPAGQRLTAKAVEKEVQLVIDENLPCYGLVIPANITSHGAPEIIVSGDVADWEDDFGVFLWGHELTHIYQMDSRLLRNLSAYGVSYDLTAPAVLEDGIEVAGQKLAEAILTERLADIIGIGAAIQHMANEPVSRVGALLQEYAETAPLFMEMQMGKDRFSGGRAVEAAWLKALMSPDGFDASERRYYSTYGRSSGLTLSECFNRAGVIMAEPFVEAQCALAQQVLFGLGPG